MRLHTVTLRHYRRHEELRVELDPARTLIGGPNESGKSTLVEAIHRALFLKAKGNSKDHREMHSLTHEGKPEVELEFEVGGQRYTLTKHFKGSSGTTRLTQTGGSTWQGDAAEEHLTQLLRPTGPSNNKLPDQWAHLWIWQGGSADNPLKQANDQRDGLMQRLQAQGGAAVIQSALDTQVATHFAAQVEAIFKNNGEPKVSSDYGRALQAEEEARENEAQARTVFQKLQQAITDHEQASLQLTEAESALQQMAGQRAALTKRLAEITALKQQEEAQARLAQEAQKQHESRLQIEHSLTQLQETLAQRRTALEPSRRSLEVLNETLVSTQKQAAEAEAQYQTAEDALRSARAQHDLARAQATLTEKTRQHSQLQQRAELIAKLTAQRREIETKIQSLPPVDAAFMRQLQELQRAQDNAEAVLKSAATEIQVLASDTPVQIGAETLSVGQSHTLTQETELTLAGTTLRIRPGGGTTLAQARQKAQDSQRQLEATLAQHALTSLADASAALAKREQWQTEVKSLTGELKGRDASQISQELSTAERDLSAALAEVQRRSQGNSDVLDLANTQTTLEQADRHQQTCRRQRDLTLAALKKAESATSNHAASMRDMEREISDLDMRLQILLEREGDDASRTQALHEALTQKNLTAATVAATRHALAQHQPQHLLADQERFDRIWKTQQDKQASANEKRISAAALLRSDGQNDPAADLALAEARTQAAQSHRQATERQAQAHLRVHQLIQQEQHTLADQFTRPLADRVSGYLQRLFGHDVQVKVTLQDNQFESLTLSRGGQTAFGFDSLSQGAREQIAAAFRLALAEILAESHDGSLPIVFDDAFAHSDPDRVQRLQSMLDLAATRGLQVLLLTCTPADYALLGAKEVRLN